MTTRPSAARRFLIPRALAATAAAGLMAAAPGAARAQAIPTPESALGFPVGADFRLATYGESVDYFHRLDAGSDRLRMIEVGRTSEGRTWWMAVISSPGNLADLDRLRDIGLRLAHPGGLTEEEARTLSRDGKAIVHIDGGLHASEVAGAQHTIQLAYDLLSGADEPKIAAILEEVVLLLWPSLNPDGQDIVVEWYRSNVGTPYEVAPLPRLYQKYIGHDNNRDAYMLDMIESRVSARTWRAWEPQIIYVHHQTAPFPTRIWLPPFAEPIATQAPPLMSRTVNMIGMAIAQGLEQNGQPGATHMGTGFDAWYPGYIDYLPMLQNAAAFWTETALYRYATPGFYTISDFPADRRDLRPGTLYPSPWEGGWWRLRDAVDYMVTASMSVLDYAAKYREDLLYNRYQSGRDVIRKYQRRPPYAYLVPREQRDPVAAVELLRRLAFNGLRVDRLTRAVDIEGIEHPAGTWVVRMDQEFAELARQVLDTQEYPDLREFPDGPPEQPYDAAGWTLPFQMDVRVIAATTPLSEETRTALEPVAGEPVDWRAEPAGDGAEVDASPFDVVPGAGFDTNPVAAGIVPPPGTTSGSGSALALDPAQNNAFAALNRALDAGAAVRYEARGGAGGRYVVSGVDGGARDRWVSDLALRAERVGGGDGPAVRRRIGLFRPWRASMDEGWTRWLLERYGFDFAGLRNAEIRAGGLRERYDVIVLPSESRDAIADGFAPGSVPPRYAGGLGEPGARALDAFVREGGTLVCLNRSSDYAIEALHLPVRDVTADLGRAELFVSGSVLEVIVDATHPVMAGMPERAKVFADRSPVFTTGDGFEGGALAVYAAEGSPLLSGYLLGEEHLRDRAAALDVRHGDGHVILLGFRPQWRGQPFGTFRVLFNAVLYGDRLAATVSGDPDFWTASESEEGEETDGG